MIAAWSRIFFITAAMLFTVTLGVAEDPPEAAPKPPADALPVPAADEPPVASADEAPVPAADASPVASGDAPPIASDDEAPVPAADEPIEVHWRLLASLNYRTGKPSEELAAVDGKLVKVPGFTVTLEDWASSAKEFLLVPYVGACIHMPPPPPNQLVYITMENDKWAFLNGWNPVWVEGVLKIEMTKSVYGYVGFTITAKRVYPYEY